LSEIYVTLESHDKGNLLRVTYLLAGWYMLQI